MFGRMMVTPIAHVGANADLQTAINSLLRAAEQAEIARWIEFPTSVLVFLLVPGDPESGAVYILDRKTGTWYSVDFVDKQYSGYSISQLEHLLKECHFLDVAERPGLWRGARYGLRDYSKAAKAQHIGAMSQTGSPSQSINVVGMLE